jgi:apolipoprotein N-acyltransferase
MVAHRSSRSWVFAAALAASLICASKSARGADNAALGLTFALSASLGHATLLPGYLSTVHYAIDVEDPMPTPWMVANLTTAALAGSLGGVAIGVAASADDNASMQLTALTGAAGVTLLIGGAAVATASVLQSKRPRRVFVRLPVESLVVVPSASPSARGGVAPFLVAAGRF